MPAHNANKESAELDNRITLRLPNDLLSWVRRQGGGAFIRDLLLQHSNLSDPASMTALNPNFNKQWEQIVFEHESIQDERLLLRDQERILDRARDRLDDERRLLDQRRELLEDEWSWLEETRMELQAREEELGAAWVGLSLAPAIIYDIAGLTLRQTQGRPLV
jgi:hypothetical protein